MKGLRLPRADWPLVAAGALLLPAAYPPFRLILPSFVCLVPAVWLILAGQDDPRPIRRQLVQGFWFGWLSNGLVLYWMVIALWHFTKLSALGYFATVSILALETGVLFAVNGWVCRTLRWPMAVVFPTTWTALEWFAGHRGDIRFPWLGIGSSLTDYPVLVQIADVTGARGITLLLATANAVLAVAWLRRADRRFALGSALAVGLGVLLATGYGAWRLRTVPLRPVGTVAVIQPSEFEKWNHAPGYQDSLMNRLLGLSRRASDLRPDLVAWPEAAVPDYFLRRPDWEAKIAQQVVQSRIPTLVGGLDARVYPDRTYDYWNAAFLFDSTGRSNQPVYHKRNLVPIVERVPFVNPRWFSGISFFGGFGIGDVGPVYHVPMGSFGLLICYESAFEGETRDYRRRGADFIVNITNDSWFGRTAAPYQHAAHLVMRAIENRVGVARAANNGISEFVDPLGRVYHATRLDDTTVVADTVFTTDVRTIYTMLGDWVGLLAVAGTVVMVGLAGRAGGKRR